MPPWDLVRDTTWEAVLAPFLAALIVGCLVDPRLRLAAVLAIVAAFLTGNELREMAEFRTDFEKPLEFRDLRIAFVNAMAKEKPPGTLPARYWLPWAGLLSGLFGILSNLPRVPRAVSWVIAAIASYLLARLVVGHEFRKLEYWWLFAVVIFANWKTLENLPPRVMTIAVSVSLFVAAGVLLYAHTARYADFAMIIAAGFGALALLTRRIDPSAAVPIAATLLPGLLFMGYEGSVSKVSQTSYILPALTPLALLPLVFFAKSPRVLPIVILVAVILMGVALGLAISVESLAFDD